VKTGDRPRFFLKTEEFENCENWGQKTEKTGDRKLRKLGTNHGFFGKTGKLRKLGTEN